MQPLSAGIRWCFQTMDHARRQRGMAMDAMGYAPDESPYEVLLSLPGLRLHYYGGDAASDKVALIIPAPIKRHYIWDLSPTRSVVRHALREGMQVYLIEWTMPEDEQAQFGLEEYGYALIDHCVDTIRAANGPQTIFLLSHSLGGVLAAIYAAIKPKRVAGLVLIETPLHFGEATGSFGPLLLLSPPARRITALCNPVPGSIISLAGITASPATFQAERYADFVASLESDESIRTHFLVERWTMDEAPMSGRLFEQVVEDLYRENRFMRGTLIIDEQALSPADIVSPMLTVYDPRSLIIPPASISTFQDAAHSVTKRRIPYLGDKGVALAHVGALVGTNAHRRLWPDIFSWIDHVGAVRHLLH